MNERGVNENEGVVNDKHVPVNERKDHVNDSERESSERGMVNESSVNESKDQVISRSWIILGPAT